jgi:hypothetical protein
MHDQQGVIERLRYQLELTARLRGATKADAAFEAARHRLRTFQAARLSRTHADLLASTRTAPAARFFLTDLYGSRDLSRVDADVRRVMPTMQRLLPAAGLETVADAIELQTLSEDLDFAMVAALGPEVEALDAASYGRAYRKVDRRSDRERQIDLTGKLGHSLDRLVQQPLIGAALSMMRTPAILAGLGDLQDFLQRGYAAFRKLAGAAEFMSLIVSRERTLLEALFAGDDTLLAG